MLAWASGAIFLLSVLASLPVGLPLGVDRIPGLAIPSLGVLVCVGAALAILASPLALRWLLPVPR